MLKVKVQGGKKWRKDQIQKQSSDLSLFFHKLYNERFTMNPNFENESSKLSTSFPFTLEKPTWSVLFFFYFWSGCHLW